ncbi:hypothetical protein [Absidia glauca]|uniref:Xylanolytic transcriptional activator regulatory domain-containing protein n=1 Tax=Absidia glauca TaxID=4829 RepID=A0A163K2E9_ABSGL|nr:hypothetical protein [Absidia glauca]
MLARRRKCMFVKNATDTYIRLDDSLEPDNDSAMDITTTDNEGQRQQESGEYLFANGSQSNNNLGNDQHQSLHHSQQQQQQQQQRYVEPFTRTERLVEQLTDGLTRLALNKHDDRPSSAPPSGSSQATKPINSDTIAPWLNFGDFVRWTPEMYPPAQYSVLLDMPTRAIQEHLINTFFSQCHSFLPTISRRLFYDQLEIKGPLITPLLLNIMYAHAAQHTSEWAHQSRSFYTRARQLLDDFLDTPRISTVMALLYLAAYDDGTWSSRSWVYSGMAARMAMDLGLYKANYYSSEMSQFDVELRKRVLWTTYVMDQLYSTLMERPPMLRTDMISLDLPTPLPEDNDQERLAVAALSHLCRLVMILEKVVHYFTTHRSGNRQNEKSSWAAPTGLNMADDGNQVMAFLSDIKYWHDLLPHTLTWYDDDGCTTSDGHTRHHQQQYSKHAQHQHWAIVNLHLLAFVLELSLLLCCHGPVTTDRGSYLVKSMSRLVSWTLHQPHLRISMTLTALAGLFCTSTLLAHHSTGIMGSSSDTNKDKQHSVMESLIFRQCLMDVRQCLQRIPVRDVQRFSFLVDSVLSSQASLSDSSFGGMDPTMKAAAAAVVTATGVVGGDHDLDLLSSVSSLNPSYFGGQYHHGTLPHHHRQQNHTYQHSTTVGPLATNYALMMTALTHSPLAHVLPDRVSSPTIATTEAKMDSSSSSSTSSSSSSSHRKQQRQMNSPTASRASFGLSSPSTTTLSSRIQRQQNHHPHSIEPADYTFELISVTDEWARSLTYETHQMDNGS